MTAGLTVALAAGLALASAAPASAATVIDPERYSATPTGWGWYFTADKTTINNWANQYNMRITNIEVNSPTNFSAIMVHNAGVYQRGVSGSSSWTTDETVDTLLAKLNGKRLLDLERYVVNGETRFAAAWVDNPASNWHNYKWYINSTETYINQKLADLGGRIIDVDHVSGDRYDVVMIPNTGADYKQSWTLFGKTMAEIGDAIALHDGRLVDIERHADGKWSAVIVKNDHKYWSWHPNFTAEQVLEMQAQKGLRPIHIKRFSFNGEWRYSVIFVDNLDDVSLKARDAIEDGAGYAKRGFYLKAVDGGTYNWLRGDTKFEPASMLKALHHVHAMRQVHLGNDALSDSVTWYKNPTMPNNGGVCAYEDDGDPITTLPVNDTLENTLKGMMEQSDNRKTDAIYNLYGGRAPLNATAGLLGMNDTTLNHRIGCTWEAAGQVKASNELTLVDAGKLYEAVYRAQSPFLGTGTARDKFTTLASDGLGIFSTMMKEEAAAIGLTQAETSAFGAAMWGAYKPGGYANGAEGATCDATGCTALLMRSTGGGMLAVPFKNSNGVIVEKKFVYGAFIDGVFDCGVGSDKDCSQEANAMYPAVTASMVEMLRPHIKAALATWKPQRGL